MIARLLDLKGTGEQILWLFAEQLAALGLSVPERQYRAPGATPVWDGEQLTVQLAQITQGVPGAPTSLGMPPHTRILVADWWVTLVREVAGMQDGVALSAIPGSEVIDQDGAGALDDAQALLLAVQQIDEQQLIASPGQWLAVGPLVAMGPQGGLAGMRLTFGVSLS